MTQGRMTRVEPDIGGFDLDRVGRWLAEAGLGGGEVTDATVVLGGTQNILVRLRAGTTELMLRRPPLHKRDGSDEAMLREARILVALKDTDVPHPRLIAVCDDLTVTGAAFFVMESVSGFNPTVTLPGAFAKHPPTQHYLGLAMVDGLVALGRVDVERAGLKDLSRSEDWIEGQIVRWSRQLESYAQMPGYESGRLAAVGGIRGWLEGNAPSGWTPGLLHGDYHFANVLFAPHGVELAAIVDWELASIGDPLLDLGHLLATWPGYDQGAITDRPKAPGLPSKAEVVARYAWLSGRSLADLRWYCVLACYRLAVLLEGTYARSRSGRAPRGIGDSMGKMALTLLFRADEMILDPSKMLG
jgi:aminoglycoside phosphotransferase (APT) family kinase protein